MQRQLHRIGFMAVNVVDQHQQPVFDPYKITVHARTEVRRRAGGVRLNEYEIAALVPVDDGTGEFCAAVEFFIAAAFVPYKQYAVGLVLAVIGVVQGAFVTAGAAVDEKRFSLMAEHERARVVVRVVPAEAAFYCKQRRVRLPAVARDCKAGSIICGFRQAVNGPAERRKIKTCNLIPQPGAVSGGCRTQGGGIDARFYGVFRQKADIRIKVAVAEIQKRKVYFAVFRTRVRKAHHGVAQPGGKRIADYTVISEIPFAAPQVTQQGTGAVVIVGHALVKHAAVVKAARFVKQSVPGVGEVLCKSTVNVIQHVFYGIRGQIVAHRKQRAGSFRNANRPPVMPHGIKRVDARFRQRPVAQCGFYALFVNA